MLYFLGATILPACQKKPPLAEQEDIYAPIRHEDFVYALSEIDSIVDISEEKLLKIYTLATRHNHSSQKK